MSKRETGERQTWTMDELLYPATSTNTKYFEVPTQTYILPRVVMGDGKWSGKNASGRARGGGKVAALLQRGYTRTCCNIATYLSVYLV